MREPGLAVMAVIACVGFTPRDAGAQDLQQAVEAPAHTLLMNSLGDTDRKPAPFVSDGCSGGMSALWQEISSHVPDFAAAHENVPPWEACCVAHDRVYHAAGDARTAEESYSARLAADIGLRQCVIDTGKRRAPFLISRYGVTGEHIDRAYNAIGDAMFKAVRMGGGPCTGLPWRWGYGYPGCL